MAEGAEKAPDPMNSTTTNDTDPKCTISDLLTQCNDYQLNQLTQFYRERLKPAFEEGVEELSLMLRQERYFSRQEHEKISELVERRNRTESSTLFLSLVMEKGSQAQRMMWESFVKMRHVLPKLDKILKEIQWLGPDPYEYKNIARGLYDLTPQMKDVQQKHKETLRTQTETLRVNTILMREKVKVFQLVDRYAELTVISSIRGRRLVEHELLARGRYHEQWREKHLRRVLEKIRIDQLFQSSFSRSKSISGSSAAVAGVPGIGKTTMVQKIVYDWATGIIFQHFQFVFTFKFRDLNSINCRVNLRELILDQYPYFANTLGEVWKNPEGLLFIFDGLDEFKEIIDFADRRRDTEPQHMCPDPEWWCEVSDIVYSLIQHKLLPGCSVLVTTRPTVLHLLEKAEISVCAEILGFVGEERKEYFRKFFEDQAVAAAVFKHVEENEILYTMSYNPSYCWILGLTLGPFFTQTDSDPQRVPKTITQLYSYYIYNIMKNHGREIESPRDVLLRAGQMAFIGVSERRIVFTDGDLIKYNLQPSRFLSGFLMELLEREESTRSVVYTFPHLTIQEFVAALAQFLTTDPGNILQLLTEAHSQEDGRFEVFLRFVAGLSSPGSARRLEEVLGPFPLQTTYRVIDWMTEEVKRQTGITTSESAKRNLLNIFHYLLESQNSVLAQTALGSVEKLSFSNLRLTPIDCAVLSHALGFCDTVKHLDLRGCHIQCEGLQRLRHGLHKCQELGLGRNELGDSGVKLVFAALRNPDCKIQKLWLRANGLTFDCVEDLVSALSTNRSLTELDLTGNKLEDSGVKLLCPALGTANCKMQILWLNNVGLTDSSAEDLASALSTNESLTEVNLSFNELGDSGMKLMSVPLRNSHSKIQKLNLFKSGLTASVAKDLTSALHTNISLTELELGDNKLEDPGVSLLSVALRNPNCKIRKLGLNNVGLTDSGTEDLASALSINRSLTELNLGGNKLRDSGVKLVSAALRNTECKIQKLGLCNTGLTDSCAEDLASTLSTNGSLTELDLGANCFTDGSVSVLRRLILDIPSLKWIWLRENQFSSDGKNQLKSLWGSRPGLSVEL